MLRIQFICVFTWVFLLGCSETTKKLPYRNVQIIKTQGKYILYRNNKPFVVRGASGSTNLRLLSESGGNTIRIWDTTHLGTILDSAHANKIAVIIGLPVSNSKNQALYANPASVAAQHQSFKSLVDRYKSHPAILMWCVGNELDFSDNWSDYAFYKAFNALTDMIHSQDPDHPVTTTVLNFNKKYIANLLLRCDIDLISFNIFSMLPFMRQDLENFSWFWHGPFMVLEWGIDGPWTGTDQTAWSAFIEDSSWKKAQIYLSRYLASMPVENSRFLGSCVFFWGYKQETTHTWFSIFDRYGGKSQPISIMKYIWTGKKPDETYPAVNFMLVNNQGAKDNIILNEGDNATAEIVLFNNKDSIRTIQWEIYKEDWYKINYYENSMNFLHPLKGLLPESQGLKVGFKTPVEEGPYRIFATVYDHKGNFSTCNTPFYVLGLN
ncbi:glycoside hydrolase family 2 TIM barrel-domain containing protein [Dyadobacter sediminis]|uniref:Glycoside hydrolase family 2 catalytic domain-containing protein n=1 Tax=Dyadobacter sediminis TaxID=1493691 RepID=A0A5R9KB46_9BACT|nr:glycoside hydrolase family 2 TIM barrel-domain containing protein [Dyadobacter sediminis]TLU92041.1 hypothetical protein FEM55_14900 [Dyadobacter sediminis]GGB97939.1 hypothetical protein GCM10011325_26580 [Dyadobacter sediminis]